MIVIFTAACVLAGCAGGKPENAPVEETERIVIFGEIKETVGNLVTLDLIERPAIREFSEEEMEEMRERFGEDGGFTRREITDEERSAMQERFGGIAPNISGGGITEEGRAIIGGGRIDAAPGIFNAEMSEEDMAALRERFGGELPNILDNLPEGLIEMIPGGMFGRGRVYTGESRDIIIPAGAPVYESSAVNGEQVETEINLDKLKAGDIIEVTYASDGETVAKVVKQPAAAQSWPGGGVRFPLGGA